MIDFFGPPIYNQQNFSRNTKNVNNALNDATSNVNNALNDATSSINDDFLAHATAAELKKSFMIHGALKTLTSVLEYMSHVRDATISDTSKIIENSQKRQEEIMNELNNEKYEVVKVNNDDSSDSKNLKIQQTTQRNSIVQKKIDGLNNQLTLEKTFVSRASQVVDRLQSSSVELSSFFSSYIRNLQSGIQSISK